MNTFNNIQKYFLITKKKIKEKYSFIIKAIFGFYARGEQNVSVI